MTEIKFTESGDLEPGDKWLTITEFAEATHSAEVTVRYWLKSGILPSARGGTGKTAPILIRASNAEYVNTLRAAWGHSWIGVAKGMALAIADQMEQSNPERGVTDER